MFFHVPRSSYALQVIHMSACRLLPWCNHYLALVAIFFSLFSPWISLRVSCNKKKLFRMRDRCIQAQSAVVYSCKLHVGMSMGTQWVPDPWISYSSKENELEIIFPHCIQNWISSSFFRTSRMFGLAIVTVLQWESNSGVIRINVCHCMLCLVKLCNSFRFHYIVCFRSQSNVMEIKITWWVLMSGSGVALIPRTWTN